jgi:hypothetical protein
VGKPIVEPRALDLPRRDCQDPAGVQIRGLVVWHEMGCLRLKIASPDNVASTNAGSFWKAKPYSFSGHFCRRRSGRACPAWSAYEIILFETAMEDSNQFKPLAPDGKE